MRAQRDRHHACVRGFARKAVLELAQHHWLSFLRFWRLSTNLSMTPVIFNPQLLQSSSLNIPCYRMNTRSMHESQLQVCINEPFQPQVCARWRPNPRREISMLQTSPPASGLELGSLHTLAGVLWLFRRLQDFDEPRLWLACFRTHKETWDRSWTAHLFMQQDFSEFTSIALIRSVLRPRTFYLHKAALTQEPHINPSYQRNFIELAVLSI